MDLPQLQRDMLNLVPEANKEEVADVGGMDLTVDRWDTREHRAEEPGRRKPDGTPNVKDEPRRELARRVPQYDSNSDISFRSS